VQIPANGQMGPDAGTGESAPDQYGPDQNAPNSAAPNSASPDQSATNQNAPPPVAGQSGSDALPPITFQPANGAAPTVPGPAAQPPSAPESGQPAPTARRRRQPAAPLPPPVFVTQASVIGILRQNDKINLPDSIHLRLYLDNTGTDVAKFDLGSFELMNPELLRFPAPIIPMPAGTPVSANPDQFITLQPGQTRWLDAYFPFPPGRSFDNTNLSALQVRWVVRVGGRNVGQDVSFHRVREYYPYYGPGWGYGAYPYPVVVGGFYYHHR
jgi:hypothetical protein